MQYCPIRLLLHAVLILLLATAVSAHADEQAPLTFGVVPQQSATKLAKTWGPLLSQIGGISGVTLRFRTAPDIPTFERRLAAGEYDLAYMNPYHYTVFSRKPGYQALAHAQDKRIKGIIITRKDAPYKSLEDLSNSTLTFPSAAAFAASILTRSEFSQLGIPIVPKYVSSHDSVYRNVAKGLYPAGGGVQRTLNAVDTKIREQLRVLWTTPGYTPHAVAVHPRVSAEMAANIQSALVALNKSEEGRTLLAPLKIKGWQAAQDSDWDDVRALDIKLLDALIRK